MASKYLNSLVKLAKSNRFYDCAIANANAYQNVYQTTITTKPCLCIDTYGNCDQCILSRSSLDTNEDLVNTIKLLE